MLVTIQVMGQLLLDEIAAFKAAKLCVWRGQYNHI